MEQVKPSSTWRGPYETLTEDPGLLRSPTTGEAVLVDVERTVHDVKISAIEGEDLATAMSPADEATTHLIADEAVAAASGSGRVACVAFPGVCLSLRRSYPARQGDIIIDFDPRFQVREIRTQKRRAETVVLMMAKISN